MLSTAVDLSFANTSTAVTGWKSVYVNKGFTKRINGITKEQVASTSGTPSDAESEATSDGSKAGGHSTESEGDHESAQETEGKEQADVNATSQAGAENGECRLLGPFALIVQAGLGVLALSSLVFKRWRERPRRPMKVWFFDVSKQVVGSVLLHLLNVLMSMISSEDYQLAGSAKQVSGEDGRQPNPCSFYLINIAVDVSYRKMSLHRHLC